MNYNEELILSRKYPKIGELGTLAPINSIKTQILDIPCEMELLLLSSNLNYQAKLILDGEAKGTGELTAIECIHQSIRIMAIVEDYKNRYITYTELKKIKKDFGLNRLYVT